MLQRSLRTSQKSIRRAAEEERIITEKLDGVVGSDNVFRDLGFPEAEAQNMMLRGDLVIQIRKVIDELGITEAEAAKRAGITQPRMNDLVKNRTHKFTLDALIEVAANL